MQVPVNPDENLLHEVFSSFPVANRSIDEVEKARLVALDQLLKGRPRALYDARVPNVLRAYATVFWMVSGAVIPVALCPLAAT